MQIPELLAPAGNMDALRAALRFGADAVYGGMKKFGLRAFAGNFGPEELAEAVRLCHAAGKKFYVTMNSYPYDDELEDLKGMGIFIEVRIVFLRLKFNYNFADIPGLHMDHGVWLLYDSSNKSSAREELPWFTHLLPAARAAETPRFSRRRKVTRGCNARKGPSSRACSCSAQSSGLPSSTKMNSVSG